MVDCAAYEFVQTRKAKKTMTQKLEMVIEITEAAKRSWEARAALGSSRGTGTGSDPGVAIGIAAKNCYRAMQEKPSPEPVLEETKLYEVLAGMRKGDFFTRLALLEVLEGFERWHVVYTDGTHGIENLRFSRVVKV